MYITTVDRPFGLSSYLGQAVAQQIDWCQRRQAIAAAARAEEARWTAPNGQKILESHASRLPVLRSYWEAVPVANAAFSAARSAADDEDFPWSAAFICFVMRTAGILPADGFVFGQKHISFIVGALRNRERSDRTRPFWLVDATELQKEATPAPGDLLCFNRCIRSNNPQHHCGGRPSRRRTTHTYSNLRARFWGSVANQNRIATGSSHTAIVVGTVEQGGQRFVETIGGNEENSVRVTRFPIDQHGNIPNPQANHIFGMIKIVGC